MELGAESLTYFSFLYAPSEFVLEIEISSKNLIFDQLLDDILVSRTNSDRTCKANS